MHVQPMSFLQILCLAVVFVFSYGAKKKDVYPVYSFKVEDPHLSYNYELKLTTDEKSSCLGSYTDISRNSTVEFKCSEIAFMYLNSQLAKQHKVFEKWKMRKLGEVNSRGLLHFSAQMGKKKIIVDLDYWRGENKKVMAQYGILLSLHEYLKENVIMQAEIVLLREDPPY